MSIKKCPHAKKCGGCQLQNLDYAEQLRFKQVKLIRLLGRFNHVDEIIGMENPERYRNKVQRAYSSRQGKVVCGVYQSSTGKVVEVDDCMIEDELSGEIAKTVAKLLVSFKIKPYDHERKTGYFRHVLIRRGVGTDQLMAVLVTGSGVFKSKTSFVNALLKRHPEITTVVHNINDGKIRLSLGNKNEVLHGDGYIEDVLLGYRFRISPGAFYQVNPAQTEVLYSKTKEFAGLTGDETVIDAYSGTGTIGMIMADSAKRVISVELNADAVKDARVNAKLNEIRNIDLHCGDAGEFMTHLAREGKQIDVVVTDPPRAGCSKDFLRSVVKLSPKRVVYVSCNPETLARDLGYLTHYGYKAVKIQGVDMFPYTEHCETVVLLSREKVDDYVHIAVHTKDFKR